MSTTGILAETSSRYAAWREIFGSNEAPLKSFAARWYKTQKGVMYMYELDLEALSTEQRQRLEAHLCRKFKIGVDDVRENLRRVGMPILADDVVVLSTDMTFL
ncbi:MAG: hypothetical protein E6Q97_20435 [Desulfurellales bacterium]|nr:MAG: hypothetical protein E6Q97_20435 [Desulfurellales bacterium]